ncbi:MAG: AAA family ATPase [Streptococcus sp.]|nr:AAA family ATPase [Streptococcus sp.]
MKITGFEIKSLHGFFNYNVKLNEDITFLYGENGSGKTTVLSMLDHVVSGEIYKLFNYNFKKITVFFKENEMEHSNKNDKVEIHLKELNNKRPFTKKISINFKDEEEIIDYERDYSNEVDYFENSFEFRKRFFDIHKLPKKIKDSFNYVFLPLNRLNYQIKDLDRRDVRILRNKFVHNSDFIFNNSESMLPIEKLVEKSVSKINYKINSLNDKIRQDILKSALEMSKANVDLDEFFKYFAKDDLISDLEDTKKRYIKLLGELKTTLTPDQEGEYNEYFDDLINQVTTNEISNDNPQLSSLSAQLYGTYVELIRIKKLIKIYEDIEEKILELKTPINDFLKFTNNFLKDGKDEKEIKISPFGEVYFITNYTKDRIKLKNLSSGEKQIVTLISNLIFKVDKSKFTIFIVDEPELSLHLSWQNKIVDTIHEINGNMQLVFATHSPEIVGRYTSKSIELEKDYKHVEKSKENILIEESKENINEEKIEDFFEALFGEEND